MKKGSPINYQHNMARVSFIIPIYGVENFIGHCADTLMQQTLQDVEFIFVNDCTKDESIKRLKEVLSRYGHRKDQIIIVEHENNKGLPAARNTGLAIATGEYIFHCDGDDFVEPTMLEELYDYAKVHDADIVWCDYYESYKSQEVYKKELEASCSDEAVRKMLSRTMQYNVWNKLVKRSLYVDNAIEFPSGFSMGEDLTMVKLFASAGRVAYLPKAYYHYVRYNTGAMTQIFDDKKMAELKHNMVELDSFLETRRPGCFSKEMSYMKLWAKYRFLLTDGRNRAYENWQNWFPESHDCIWTLPNANIRIKSLYWSASKKQWWLVWLHYWVVLRGYYSLKHRNVDLAQIG